MTGKEEFVYARGELSVDEIQFEIAKFWQILGDPVSPALEDELSAVGLDRVALANVNRENAIIVRAGTSGVDSTTAGLLVTLAPSANLIIEDLWKKIVLPRIRRRWGDDAIGEEKRLLR
jgi:hypothetical protein